MVFDEATLFCASIIFILILILFIRLLVDLFSDKTYLDDLNFQHSSDSSNDCLVSVVYECKSDINDIIKDLQKIYRTLESKVENRKFEVFLYFGNNSVSNRNISLISKIFPNIIIKKDTENSAINFALASFNSKGKYIINFETLDEELNIILNNNNNQQQNYASIANLSSQIKFSAISKSISSQLKRIHFINIFPINEFIYICNKNGITINTINKNAGDFDILPKISQIISNILCNIMYGSNIWKLQKTSNVKQSKQKVD